MRYLAVAAFALCSPSMALAGAHEENLLRLAYAKLVFATRMERVASVYGGDVPEPGSHIRTSPSLAITLSNITSGNFDEIRYRPATEVIELQHGAVLSVVTGQIHINRNGVMIGRLPDLRVAWDPREVEPPNTAVPLLYGEVISASYPGVQWQSWASAEVHLTFEGRSRQYKATLLLGTQGPGKPRVFLCDYVALAVHGILEGSLYPDGLAAEIVTKAPDLFLAPEATGDGCFADPADPRLCCDLKKLDCLLRPPAPPAQ